MPKIKITAAAVRDLPTPERGQILYTDETLPGFGLRVGTTSRAYFAEARVNGRTRRATIGPANVFTPDQARKEAKKLLGKMAGGQDVNAERAEARARGITLRDAYADFLKGRDLKPNTRRHYDEILSGHFADWFPKELRSITPLMIVQRHRKILDGSGPGAANGAARTFRAVWNFTRAMTAAPDGTYTMPESPTRRLTDLRQWAKLERRTRHLTTDLFPAFRAALVTLREDGVNAAFADFMELLLRSGLRRSEAAGLLWEDVNLSNRTLTVRDTKNGKDHTLPLSSQLVTLMERRASEATGERVFPGCADPRKSLDRLCQLVGADLSAHDFRRSFATVADGLDLSTITLRRLLNHSTKQDVTAGYVVADVERLRVAAQRISDAMDRLMSPTTLLHGDS